ncbi:glycosyltransferase family 2 protein [Psychrobacter sp. 2Y5]|uniref:glycosyltransferase family 2 protein n=1 Tax=unclassified Psychrobacter TaxID=196806 RepID=UPI003F484647
MNPTTETQYKTIDISVITTCYGRNRHLYNLLSSLANSSVRPSEVIIVNDDADPKRLAQYPLNIVQIPTSKSQLVASIENNEVSNKVSNEVSNRGSKTGFDIGRNRNLGAAKASHEQLIFLDVDCIVSTTFIEYLSAKLTAHPDALLMGQPLYLTRPLTDEESLQSQQGNLGNTPLNALAVTNPYRHNLVNQAVEQTNEIESQLVDQTQSAYECTQDYGAFWSLCFAITQSQFQHIGGFDTHYIGYGAEDTDFAFMARALNIEFYLTSDVVFHQQHSVYRPPLNHLSSIVINANRFYDKWQHWPMGGWLASFTDMQLIDWQPEQQNSITIIRQPTDSEIEAACYPDAPYV